MFDFLFKRPSGKPSTPPSTPVKQAAKPPAPATPPDPAKAALAQQAAQMARLRAETLVREAQDNSDSAAEEALVQFIIACEFADARLIAAQAVQTRPMLARAYQAVRNLDRRVAKLMQSRLDELSRRQTQQQQAQQTIAQAQALCEPHAHSALAANQVAELDRAWQAVVSGPAPNTAQAALPSALVQQFDALRAQLARRLAAQAALQRQVLDAIAAVRAHGGLDAADATAALARLDALAQEVTACAAAPEAASLPRHLLGEFASLHAQAIARLTIAAQQQTAAALKRAALAQWRQEPLAALDAGQLRQSWNGWPTLDGDDGAALQTEFDTLLAAVREAQRAAKAAQAPASADGVVKRAAKSATPEPDTADSERQLTDALAAMDAALQQGALQLAAQQDKLLRDLKPKRLSDQQNSQLANLRLELARLTGWAKWGGNVSREELVKAVEELPALALGVTELAKKVGSSRDSWKALDTQSGPAPKALWERFDAACTTAYAPAAAHFKQLADERRQNVDKARAVIAELRQFAQTAGIEQDGAAVDWKALAAFCQGMQSAWRQTGPLDRKEKKALDHEFDAAMDVLRAPLARHQQAEIAQRERWIVQTEALVSNDRGALDTLKSLQLQWQEKAKSLPLPRAVEQQLWQRFRAACDAVFAERKQSHQAADLERQQHLQAKEAVCAQLESAALDAALDAGAALRQAHTAWQAIGDVPRANEDKIKQRYQAACAALEQRQQAVKRAASAAQASARRDKLLLCQALDTALAGLDPIALDDWRARWQALPALPGSQEKTMAARFDGALAAAGDDGARGRYQAALTANQAPLLQALLRLEIQAGLDSPAQFAADRLKMQVDVLQQSFKAGGSKATPAEQLAQLCVMPALPDAIGAARIDKLFAAIAG